MTEHTKTDGLPDVLERARPRNERMAVGKIECNACPVLCQISPGRTGACDRYANAEGVLVRVDPVVLLRRTLAEPDAALVPFALRRAADTAEVIANPLATQNEVFVTGIGSGTTYPD